MRARIAWILASVLVGIAMPAWASSLRISAGSKTRLTAESEADYTISRVFVDEIAGDKVPITVFFDPQIADVETAEVFTNLNRRERATQMGPNGLEEGIQAPAGNGIQSGDDGHYYKAYTMKAVAGGYLLTLWATRCGAYRLTARYRRRGDPPQTYRWYGSELDLQGTPKRDHAIVVSPGKTREIRMYEANPLTVLATGTAPGQRGTLADLANGLPGAASPRFSLQYLKELGCNTLWLQPIHPRGIAGRMVDRTTNAPFELGSPYAVKSYLAVMPLLAKAFVPTGVPQTDDTPSGRELAMTELQQFVRAADQQRVDVLLDAPFNHGALDLELSFIGQSYWGTPASTPLTEIRAVEARVFSRADAYDLRAHDAASIARAPDRYDFGKWNDVADIYFGRYAALVPNQGQANGYKDEGDWFDYSTGIENATGMGNGHFDAITVDVWRYFGDYLQFWLTQTGYPINESGGPIDSAAGIDGLRADFAQGLPPQCWEYIINRTRARKWNFIFMAESLDGGAVTYRSARHFDVLDDNLIYDLYQATSASDFRRVYEQRRTSYGATPVLLNTSSQDEDNYRDPFEALLRYAVGSTIDGAPMIFSGQEIGLRGTVVAPHRSDPAFGPPFGYDRYQSQFGDKPIPGFMMYNSMMPLWRQLVLGEQPARSLKELYADVNRARAGSPALRAGSRAFLNLRNGVPHQQIFSIGKIQRRNADPRRSDVVFAFVNLTVTADAATLAGNAFDVNVDADHDGFNDFGIKPDRLYNVKNIAAYAGADAGRPDSWLWGAGRTGRDLLKNGIPVRLNRVPANPGAWASAPYEAQYLKLVDVTK